MQCKSIVRQYLPQIIQAVQDMPLDAVRGTHLSLCHPCLPCSAQSYDIPLQGCNKLFFMSMFAAVGTASWYRSSVVCRPHTPVIPAQICGSIGLCPAMEAQAQEYVQRRLLGSMDPKSSRATMLRNMINTGRVRISTPMTTPAWAQLVKAGAKAKGVQVRGEGRGDYFIIMTGTGQQQVPCWSIH
jgi:hypothetical protein